MTYDQHGYSEYYEDYWDVDMGYPKVPKDMSGRQVSDVLQSGIVDAIDDLDRFLEDYAENAALDQKELDEENEAHMWFVFEMSEMED
jgi:hypothetical protein